MVPASDNPFEVDVEDDAYSLRIGRFTIVAELGRGGCGVVLLALDPQRKERIALKVPRPQTLASPSLKRQFIREGLIVSTLNHPNIVPVYDVGEAGSICYIASAYCEGASLDAWLKQQSQYVDPKVAASMVAALAVGIQHAHEQGVLHRDLKPANVMLRAIPSHHGGEPRLVPQVGDFGLAKVMEQSLTESVADTMFGTPAYMAPEQAVAKANKIGPAVDIYGLGAILYELLTDQPPFLGPTKLENLPPRARRRASVASGSTERHAARPRDHLPRLPSQVSQRTLPERP